MKRQIEDVSAKTGAPEFWQDREEAEAVLARLKRLRGKYEPWEELVSAFGDFADLYELVLAEKDVSLEADIAGELKNLEKRYEDLNLLSLLGQENDAASAFLTIHSGAGGTEACDWVSMLLRMYTRWAEERGYACEIIDLMEAEGGIKSVTVEVKGEYAYGFLKAETGIHRLVRISPFDSSSRRHTSFASLSCSPVLDDSIDVEIKPEDIRVDTYRSAGAGGQHVNKTDSAVRITHFPTGIVVQCQNERSQHKNKSMAMAVLRSRLYEHYRREQDKERQKLEQEKKDIAWGNQIRSYVFHPYSMVKDHRTKHETGNIQAVMDGALDPFIEAYLRMVW
jgi:peptide chain release factor 2